MRFLQFMLMSHVNKHFQAYSISVIIILFKGWLLNSWKKPNKSLPKIFPYVKAKATYVFLIVNMTATETVNVTNSKLNDDENLGVSGVGVDCVTSKVARME